MVKQRRRQRISEAVRVEGLSRLVMALKSLRVKNFPLEAGGEPGASLAIRSRRVGHDLQASRILFHSSWAILMSWVMGVAALTRTLPVSNWSFM